MKFKVGNILNHAAYPWNAFVILANDPLIKVQLIWAKEWPEYIGRTDNYSKEAWADYEELPGDQLERLKSQWL